MARLFEGDTLVIASHNNGKVREIAELLAGRVATVVSAAERGLTDPEETGTTFVANAELKAHFVASRTGLPALADDSGLVVPALGGTPGVHTARWAVQPDGSRDFAAAMRKLNAALDEALVWDRRAHFVCVLALAWPDGHCETCEGKVFGTLVWPPRGDRGFGYDPVFVADDHALTFGEMEPAAKHAISHRAVAFKTLVNRCFTGAASSS